MYPPSMMLMFPLSSAGESHHKKTERAHLSSPDEAVDDPCTLSRARLLFKSATPSRGGIFSGSGLSTGITFGEGLPNSNLQQRHELAFLA
jgi:hypothetical protein